MTDYFAYDKGLPCRNPHCKSHGKPHPNCKCYGQGATSQAIVERYASGGKVESYCSRNQPHQRGCEYYAEGGEISAPPQPLPQFAENSSVTLGHAAADQGLLGLLRDIGHPKMVE